MDSYYGQNGKFEIGRRIYRPFPRYSGAISAVTDGSPEDINEMPACLNKTEECTIYGEFWPGSSKLEVVLIRGL